MENNLPEESIHQPTVDLINCAYPLGIPNAHYLTLLSILEKDMSIRVLASVIAHLRGGHYSIYMVDVMESMNFRPDNRVVNTIMEKLLQCGYEEWQKE